MSWASFTWNMLAQVEGGSGICAGGLANGVNPIICGRWLIEGITAC